MSDLTKPAPRPWETYPIGSIRLPGGTWTHGLLAPPPPGMADDVCPAKALGRTKEEATANAELIVRAVNSHDVLLAACRLVLLCDGYSPDPFVSDAIDAAKSAIADATRKETP